jgi:hypothetical protein
VTADAGPRRPIPEARDRSVTGRLASRVMKARRESLCIGCRKPIRVGDLIAKCGVWMCISCAIAHQHDNTDDPATRGAAQEGTP